MTEVRGSFALSSMTGFAACAGRLHDWSWTVEMRSVNGRGLDLRFRLPDWIDGLEPELRKLAQARLHRGNVTISVRLQREDSAQTSVLNPKGLEQALAIVAEIEARSRDKGLRLREISATEIAALRGVLDQSDASTSDTSPLRSAIVASTSDCLAAFMSDREREGAAIGSVIAEQIDRMEALVADARIAAGDREVTARRAIERAVSRLLDVTEVPDEARLTQELALIAVKNDITEEIDRLGAHIAAARLLLAESGAVGRKFDFLMQEFNREANTLCSKSQSSALTAIGLDLKALIDQMREQVQNIE